MGNGNKSIIRKSPITIVRNFIGVQFAAFAVYVLVASLGYYAKFYRTLPWADTISFDIAKAVFILGAEIFLTFLIFFQWHKNYVSIDPKKIVHGKGILWKNRLIVPIEQVATVSFRQTPLGRLTKYGTLELEYGTDNKAFRIRHIPEPAEWVSLILKYKRARKAYDERPITPQAVLTSSEDKKLEFKSTLRWDLKTGKVNKELEKAAVKTIASFLNSEGGTLVIGVGDGKEVIGLDYDCTTLTRKDLDGFENHFYNILNAMIGPEFIRFIDASIARIKDKNCFMINVQPSDQPAYVHSDDDREEFYVRTGNNTTALKISSANSYIKNRFD